VASSSSRSGSLRSWASPSSRRRPGRLQNWPIRRRRGARAPPRYDRRHARADPAPPRRVAVEPGESLHRLVDVPSLRAASRGARRGEKLRGHKIDKVHTSVLKRAIDTATIALQAARHRPGAIERDPASRAHVRRPPGARQGGSREALGDEQVKLWRRSYDVRPPGGESLADTAARVLRTGSRTFLPELRAGRTCSSSRTATRSARSSLHLDGLTRDQVLQLEIPTGRPSSTSSTADGRVRDKRYLCHPARHPCPPSSRDRTLLARVSRRRLEITRCRGCGWWIHPPRPVCPAAHGARPFRLGAGERPARPWRASP